VGCEVADGQKLQLRHESQGGEQEDMSVVVMESFPSGVFTSTPLTPRRRNSDFGIAEMGKGGSGEMTVEF
jgi:hypothetical protein